mgnify:CR=1 FL=1
MRQTEHTMLPEKIRNIFCVGRNYESFARQMGNKVTENPIIFMKPTHSLCQMDGSAIEIPGDRGEVNGEAEIVLHIARPYEQGMKVEDLVDQASIGIDFTFRDVLNEVKANGKPWLIAKGFPGFSAVGRFLPFNSFILQQDFQFFQNGKLLQTGNIRNMIFSFQNLVDFIAANFGLGPGDIIYTGIPEGIGKLKHRDHLEVRWGNEVLGSCAITFKQNG